jgi:CO/xanthine dehydrogenase FAD-binding subunit
MGDYVQPVRLEEALDALARPHAVLAGGTDFYPARVGRTVGEDILDISRI